MVGLSKKRVFPKTKGDSITGQDRAQKHCDFRFSQIEKKILSRSSATRARQCQLDYIESMMDGYIVQDTLLVEKIK